MPLLTETRQINQYKQFIRDTLGCGCPDAVFETIDVSTSSTATRIVVGDTLLLYISIDSSLTHQAIIDLSSQGKTERDQQGYNRFRLVLTERADHDNLSALFQQTHGNDEKMHLHFLPASSLPSLPDKSQ